MNQAQYEIELRLNGTLIGDIRNIAQNLTWRRCRTATGVDEIDFTLNDQEFSGWCQERGTTIDQMLTPYALDARVIRNGVAVAGGFLATMPAYQPQNASANLQLKFDGYINLLAGVYIRPTALQPATADQMVVGWITTRKHAPPTPVSHSESRKGASRRSHRFSALSIITRVSKRPSPN